MGGLIDLGCGVEGSRVRVERFRVQGSGFRVQGSCSRSRVQGLEIRKESTFSLDRSCCWVWRWVEGQELNSDGEKSVSEGKVTDGNHSELLAKVNGRLVASYRNLVPQVNGRLVASYTSSVPDGYAATRTSTNPPRFWNKLCVRSQLES
eukprot:3909415-Rhodomonas_salina.4